MDIHELEKRIEGGKDSRLVGDPDSVLAVRSVLDFLGYKCTMNRRGQTLRGIWIQGTTWGFGDSEYQDSILKSASSIDIKLEDHWNDILEFVGFPHDLYFTGRKWEIYVVKEWLVNECGWGHENECEIVRDGYYKSYPTEEPKGSKVGIGLFHPKPPFKGPDEENIMRDNKFWWMGMYDQDCIPIDDHVELIDKIGRRLGTEEPSCSLTVALVEGYGVYEL